MTFSTKVLAPNIYMYENIIDFSSTIVDLTKNDSRNWNIRNQDATNWKPGDSKIVGYDEYPINFDFSVDENFLILAKRNFDCAANYAIKNLTRLNGYNSILIRRYSNTPGFLELESSDVDDPSRKITSILFLNDIDDGGQLTFKNFDVSVFPKQGSVVIFPASFAYSFKINKPKREDSFIVVSHFV